ncbi:Hsp70 family protein [Dactylosporangium darangshiense]|uniref:Hsp70 family protein n=1 Tax=Dactylosporangium darangshiense TaxID=579108 RepID=A0ABP8DJH0_9ACTN
MPYALGVDIGESFTSAAVCRRDGSAWTGPLTVRLGARSPSAASLIELSPTGALHTGDGVRADEAAGTGRILRGFVRRIGDDVPMVVDGRSYRPQDLLAALVRLVVDRLREQEGEACEQVALTHPAGWGPHRLGALFEALREIGLDDVVLLPGPAAAAEACAASAALLAGCDLGGSACTTFLVRRPARGPVEVLAHEEHAVGGADLDDALVAHVRAAIGRAVSEPPPDADSGPVAVLLRRDCTGARERLSEQDEAEVPLPWWAPDAGRALPVTRAELSAMARPILRGTVESLVRLVEEGEQEPAAVLLVGGAAATPLVAEMITERLALPILRDDEPQSTAARGAALVARRASMHRVGS